MLIEKILAEFPDAYDLAYQRIFAGRTIFFDTKTHRPLPGFSEPKILACLILAQLRVKDEIKLELRLRLTEEEKDFWDRYFS